MAIYTPNTIERFWANVDKRGPDECWPWLGSMWKRNYGRMKPQGSRYYRGATKISYELHKGDVPDGLGICHSCDNPPCVNPAHLWLGTALQNMQDAMAKGRKKLPPTGAGEKNQRALLTDDQAREIFRRLGDGETNRSVSADFPISEKAISNMKRGKSWRHLRA